jgi:alkylhydroperoxidase/carboxymuconolactone decarboxylase family protein YurZ
MNPALDVRLRLIAIAVAATVGVADEVRRA